MQIPASPPDLSIPLIARREVQPVQPITAAPGLSEIAEHLDSRVALQWTQPVFQGESADPTRSALMQVASPLLSRNAQHSPQTQNPAPSKGIEWSTASASLQALLSGSSPIRSATTLPLWSQTQGSTPTSNDDAPDVIKRMASAYQELKSSKVFAAQHLAQTMLSQGVATPEGETPSLQQLQQWMACLAPDNETAQQAANMLMTGQMVWQGELQPGMAVRMQREDAWRESAAQAGQLEKGACLVVDITLPRLGQLKIIGHKWQDKMDLAVQFSATGKQVLAAAWPQLEERLQAANGEGLQAHWVERK